MTEAEYAQKLEELDQQLNDPDILMDPARVWALLADLRERANGSYVALSGVLPSHLPPTHGAVRAAPIARPVTFSDP